MLFATPTYTLNRVMRLASYDLLKEFAPVAIIGLISYALVTNPSVPAKSVRELVAYAKAILASSLRFGGIGTAPHVACEYLNKLAATNILHVPYRDVSSGMMATVGNVTQMFFGVATNAKPQIESGALRGLAVSTARRSQLLPELPTMIESGCPTFDMPGWGGLITTAGTPVDVIEKLNQEVQRAVARRSAAAAIRGRHGAAAALWAGGGAAIHCQRHRTLDAVCGRDRYRKAEGRSYAAVKAAVASHALQS